MKKVNKDPFSNGTDFMIWEEHNCNKCIKSSEPRISEEDGLIYYTNKREDGLPKCSIQRNIVTRMFNNEPINEQTVTICNDFTMRGILCPYMKTERKKYIKKDKQQTTLEL